MINNEVRMTGYVGNRNFRNNTATGIVVGLNFSLAINRRIPDPEKPGEYKDHTDWFPVFISAKNRSFEFLSKHIVPGAMVHVGAFLSREVWESKTRVDEKGAPKMDYRTDIIATEVQILRYAKNETQPGNAPDDVPGDDTPPDDFSQQTPPPVEQEPF